MEVNASQSRFHRLVLHQVLSSASSLIWGWTRRCMLFLLIASPKSSSSSHVSVDFHTKFVVSNYIFSYGCGLIYLESEEAERVICNPITGEYTILPELEADKSFYSFLGFDPIDKQFKLLAMNTNDYMAYSDLVHQILTLGSGNIKWRNVHCPFTHEPFYERICINGVLYYFAQCLEADGRMPYVIVYFDVRSEEFKFIDTEGFSYGHPELVNYKGKFGAINCDSGKKELKLRMWVLEDVEKPEWSKYVYTLHMNKLGFDFCDLSVVGVTAIGEIVLSKEFTCKPFYVSYFNPEKDSIQRVEIHGNHQVLENRNRVYAFVDHVEDLKKERAITEEVANGSRYKEADKSCKVISGRLSRGSGCLIGTAITAVVLAAAGAVVLSSNPEATTELMNPVDSYANAIITALKN